MCFDEALNHVVQRGQMDLVVRFWDVHSSQVSSGYLTSLFLGHATASDLLVRFREGLQSVTLTKLVQVSMDGPSVNWKFLDELKKDLRTDKSDRELLNMGSCGQHIVHGTFQTGHKASGWNVNGFLRAIYTMFKDSPARRADYVQLTGSSMFPLKFCQVRWVENAATANRALTVFDDIKKYVSETAKRLPHNSTCSTVITACSDKSLKPQLAFFASVANDVEPFL